ncbi:hypothetical protein BDW42DRAFT_93691 [Aspergillus taichungensis]|uniref:GPI anchored protein n=1 Tax=Aspergillus taichungensis TaxID=482145 RepID=A0A2J5I8T5_9EURO|nr:hypothetical protein BDW42DRAFT_93691 [Aspergillus taichungensis]
MKGFVGGVPVALLAAAALAQAQESIRGPAHINGGNNVRRHHADYVPGGNTLIGAPSGSDSGNDASIEFDSEFSSEVNDAYKDDHGVDVNKATDYHPHPVQNDVEEPFPDPFPVPFLTRKRQYGNTAIGGTSGSDIGNDADLSLEAEFSSEVNEGPIPIPYRRRAKRQGNSLIGGPGGSDDGNSASYDSENEFDSEVNDAVADDHHVDYDELNDIHPHPIENDITYPVEHYPVPVIFKRQGNTVIGGPGGSDDGNSAGYESENEFDSEVNDAFADDHHIDYDELNDIHPHPIENDITYPVDHPYPIPGFVKRQGNTVIGGPEGSDDGNSASYDSENEFGSEVNEAYGDDHHLDYDELNNIHPHPIKNDITYPVHEHYPIPGFVKRQGNSLIGGPGGSDDGNSASYDSENEFGSEVNNAVADDHHIDYDELNDIHPHPIKNNIKYPVHEHYPVPAIFKRQGNSVIGGPGGSDNGNDADYDSENELESKVNNLGLDDHHIDYDKLNNVHPHPVYNEAIVADVVGQPFHDPLIVKRQGESMKARAVDEDFDFDSDSDSDDDDHHTAPFKGGNTLIGGPGGSDTGNDAGYDVENEFGSEVNDAFEDDHHIDYDEATDIHPHPVHNNINSYPVPHPVGVPLVVKRQGNSVIGGPGGSDSGNDADYESEHELGSEVNEGHIDDHHIDTSVVNDIGGGGVYNHQTIPHHVPGFVPLPRDVPAANGGHGGNDYPGPIDYPGHNGYPGHIGYPGPIGYPGHGDQPGPIGYPGHEDQPGPIDYPGPGVFKGPQNPAAVNGPAMQASAQAPGSEADVHGPASQHVPTCSTVLHEVVHTVTQTLPSKPTATHLAMSSAVPMVPPVHHAPASSDLAGYGAIKDFLASKYAVPTAAMPNAATHTAQHPASTVTLHKAASSAAHMHAIPTGAVPGVPTHGAQYLASTATPHGTPSSSAHTLAMPSGAMPIGATHPAQHPASTLTVQAASTFVAIPVYVPGASSVASSSGVAPAGSSHSSVAKASQYAPASSTPAKHHGMMFTGGAAAFSPNTALVSVFCGAVALLAYAL